MEESCGSNSIDTTKRSEKCVRNRRSWAAMEERVLIQVLKELVTKGWKYGNGFKPGYLNMIEAELKCKLPASDLRHINSSKITVWKKQHKSLLKIGIRLNDTTKLIDCNNDAWEKVVKKYPDVVKMLYKPWPYLDDWNEIFGEVGVINKDASGANAAQQNNVNSQPPDVEKAIQSRSSGTKNVGNDKDKDCRSYEKRMERFGYKADLGKARSEVFNILDGISGISMDEKMDASYMLLKKAGHFEMFLGFPQDVRARYVHRLLAGDFENPVICFGP